MTNGTLSGSLGLLHVFYMIYVYSIMANVPKHDLLQTSDRLLIMELESVFIVRISEQN